MSDKPKTPQVSSSVPHLEVKCATGQQEGAVGS